MFGKNKKEKIPTFNPAYWYDAYFNRFHFCHWFYRMKLKALISLVPANAKTVLDCGTGSGLLPYLLELRGYEADGFDILDEFVEYGKNKLKKGVIYQDDITVFKAPKEKYDILTCIDIIKRFPPEQRESIYRHIAEYLNKGGRLIVCNASPFFFRMLFLWRMVIKVLFPGMIYQGNVCGRNLKTAQKVEHYDKFGALRKGLPLDIFKIVKEKKIVLGILNIVVAERI